jgi:hypothetical protein
LVWSFEYRLNMAKKARQRIGLADPSRLPPLDADDADTMHVMIETPKGSRNKYAFDVKRKLFVLKKVLPVGMAFPCDFGFVPSTRAEDGRQLSRVDRGVVSDSRCERSPRRVPAPRRLHSESPRSLKHHAAPRLRSRWRLWG